MTTPYTSLTCPLPNCDGPLHLMWDGQVTLYRFHFDTDHTDGLPSIRDCDVQTWRVECEAGHVIAVPGEMGCACDVPCACDADYDETNRTFRFADLDRLRSLLTAGVAQ